MHDTTTLREARINISGATALAGVPRCRNSTVAAPGEQSRKENEHGSTMHRASTSEIHSHTPSNMQAATRARTSPTAAFQSAAPCADGRWRRKTNGVLTGPRTHGVVPVSRRARTHTHNIAARLYSGNCFVPGKKMSATRLPQRGGTVYCSKASDTENSDKQIRDGAAKHTCTNDVWYA